MKPASRAASTSPHRKVWNSPLLCSPSPTRNYLIIQCSLDEKESMCVWKKHDLMSVSCTKMMKTVLWAIRIFVLCEYTDRMEHISIQQMPHMLFSGWRDISFWIWLSNHHVDRAGSEGPPVPSFLQPRMVPAIGPQQGHTEEREAGVGGLKMFPISHQGSYPSFCLMTYWYST